MLRRRLFTKTHVSSRSHLCQVREHSPCFASAKLNLSMFSFFVFFVFFVVQSFDLYVLRVLCG
jgi:hypothetical protein